jgi:prepilin peptidase CpaA
VVLLVAVWMDFDSYKIKNQLIILGMAAGIVLWMTVAGPDIHSGIDLLTGILLPIIICWIPFRMHALGAGDIKLFSVIGCLNGGKDVICCIVFSFLLAAGISLGRLLSHRQLRQSLLNCFRYFQSIYCEGSIMPYPQRDEPGHHIHFSAAILLGYAVLLGVKVCKNMPSF